MNYLAETVATGGVMLVAIGLCGVSLYRRPVRARADVATRIEQLEAEVAHLRDLVAGLRVDIVWLKKNLSALQTVVDELDRDVLNAVLGWNERLSKHIRNR